MGPTSKGRGVERKRGEEGRGKGGLQNPLHYKFLTTPLIVDILAISKLSRNMLKHVKRNILLHTVSSVSK